MNSIQTYQGILTAMEGARTYQEVLTYYAVLWPVLNGISITRSPVEIPFRALLLWKSSSGTIFVVP